MKGVARLVPLIAQPQKAKHGLDWKAATVVLASAVAVLSACVAFFVFRDRASHSTRAPASPPSAAATLAMPDVSVRSPQAATHAPARPIPSTVRDGLVLDEAALMETLRELRGSDPNLSLQLAREGNRRFKASADAAERSWFAVRALSELGRHDEARLEGRALVDAYRDSPWAEDIYRHLFVNPPTHPFERGYGKKLELDP